MKSKNIAELRTIRPLLIKALPEFCRRDIADGGVSTLPVVIAFNISKDSSLCLHSGRVMLVINPFQLDRAEERFDTGVVVRHALAAHTGNNVVSL